MEPTTSALARPLTSQEVEAIKEKFSMFSENLQLVIIQSLQSVINKDGVQTELLKMANAPQLAGGKLGLFTGQYADIPLAILVLIVAEMGYKEIELCGWGDHFNFEEAAGPDGEKYCHEKRALVEASGMKISAISMHLDTQGALDRPTARLKGIISPKVWSDDPVTLRQNVQELMMKAPLAAKRIGVGVVVGFLGSQIWDALFDFPPNPAGAIADAYKEAAEFMAPVLQEFKKLGIRYALEVHPTELVYSFETARAFIAALKIAAPDCHEVFGFVMDPSHFPGQGLDPIAFVLEFADRIFHVHAKDVTVTPSSTRSTYADHLPMGNPNRHWNFVSGGRGVVDWYGLANALIFIKYQGAISVEWEQGNMNRLYGLWEAFTFFTKALLFPVSLQRFDDAFAK